jgi:hypothetical protein
MKLFNALLVAVCMSVSAAFSAAVDANQVFEEK